MTKFELNNLNSNPVSPKLTMASKYKGEDWLLRNFSKRECCKFIPTKKGVNEKFVRCGCGRGLIDHSSNESVKIISEVKIKTNQEEDIKCENDLFVEDLKWNSLEHTVTSPTDAYGTLEFQGTGEGDKSQYIRFAHDTNPLLVMKLLVNEWKLNPPSLVITVHGGTQDFQLQKRIRKAFCDGLIKAAETTGAWVMSYGLDRGIGRIVGKALRDHKAQSRSKISSIGVAPWGMVDYRENLISNESIKAYLTMSNPVSKGVVLNTGYSHFLFVDNGTVGRGDCEIQFRRLLEEGLSQRQISGGIRRGSTSMVCVVLEGGKNVINVVQKCVQQTPPIPVIVCDGSGRAADLLAFAHANISDEGEFVDEKTRNNFLHLIKTSFSLPREQANFYLSLIIECVKRKDLITIFRLGHGQDDMDKTILSISLKARCKSAPDMLKLAQSWDRVDIAASQIFVYGQQWPVLSLEQAMMEALINNQVDFVKILMDNGVSMHKFLSIGRLQQLYNAIKLPLNIEHILKEIKRVDTINTEINLIDIGNIVQLLMGGDYKSRYTRKCFRTYYLNYERLMKQKKNMGHLVVQINSSNLRCRNNRNSMPKIEEETSEQEKAKREFDTFKSSHFSYPFHELLVWAVIFQRQNMALFMWQQGEEAVAKALVAHRMYKSMSAEAEDDDLDLVGFRHLKDYAKNFEILAIQMLEVCYKNNESSAKRLLTYELTNWGRQTCLNLAVSSHHTDFLAHPCCQLLLNDLWYGALANRKLSTSLLILAVIFPPFSVMLPFKKKEHLKLLSHSKKTSQDESELSSSSSSSSSSEESDEDIEMSTSAPKKSRFSTEEDPERLMEEETSSLKVHCRYAALMNAPVAKFYSFAIFYLLVLFNYSTIVLRNYDEYTQLQEHIVFSYVISKVVDTIHEVSVDTTSLRKKIIFFFNKRVRILEMIMMTPFTIVYCVRLITGVRDSRTMSIYGLNICFWYLFLLYLLSKTKLFGVHITVMCKLMQDLLNSMVVILVLIFAFGVPRVAILQLSPSLSFLTLRDIVLEPYFMLYGEVYADKIDPCHGSNPELCTFLSPVVPVLMIIFLLAAVLITLNQLIANFNSTYARVKGDSDKIWMFQRYSLIWSLNCRPKVPIPFSIFAYLFQALSYPFRKNKRNKQSYGLKLYLDSEAQEALHDFEEDCVDDYFRDRRHLPVFLLDERNKKLDKNSEGLCEKCDEVGERQTQLDHCISEMCTRVDDLLKSNSNIFKLVARQQQSHLPFNDHLQRTESQLSGNFSNPGSGADLHQSSTSSSSSSSSVLLPLSTIRRQRRARVRQDSEMSSTSGWMIPPYIRNRSHHEMFGSSNKPGSFNLSKTHSTGEIDTCVDACSDKSLTPVVKRRRVQSCHDVLMMGGSTQDMINSRSFSFYQHSKPPATPSDKNEDSNSSIGKSEMKFENIESDVSEDFSFKPVVQNHSESPSIFNRRSNLYSTITDHLHDQSESKDQIKDVPPPITLYRGARWTRRHKNNGDERCLEDNNNQTKTQKLEKDETSLPSSGNRIWKIKGNRKFPNLRRNNKPKSGDQ